jgi:hypothetical protein
MDSPDAIFCAHWHDPSFSRGRKRRISMPVHFPPPDVAATGAVHRKALPLGCRHDTMRT